MKVISHYPTSIQCKFDLQNAVAIVHEQIILLYVQNLNCSKTQKLRLIEQIIKEQYGTSEKNGGTSASAESIH